MTTDHLLLLDASGSIHRAFHAAQPTYRSDGLPTWAILGFLSMTYALLARAESDPPTHAAAVFDAKGKNFRHKLFPAYKAGRPAARRVELEPQLDFVRHAALALGLEPVEASGYEADDVLVTLARMAKTQGIRTTIVSGDKDLLQCVEDGVVEVIDPVLRPRRNADGTQDMVRRRFLAADVRKKFGVSPALVPDAQALSGDSVDNIPGIDGIGPDMAGRLIRRFGSLEKLLIAAGQSGEAIESPTIKRRLRAHADDARLYKKLATLRADVPLGIQLDTLARRPIERDHLKEMLRLLEAGDRYEIMFGGEPGITMRAKHVPAPLQWWAAQVKGIQRVIADVPVDPQDGFYKRRLVRNGPWVPGRIWRTMELDFATDKETGFDVIHCEVGGKPRHPMRHWDALGQNPITKDEFDKLIGVTAAALPDEPAANPAAPINLQSVSSIPNPRVKRKANV